MNRFSANKEIRLPRPLRILSALFIAGFFVLFLIVPSFISNIADEEQCKNLETTLRRDILQCYAVEGTYPPSLDYLEENYGFFYDTDKFYIDYIAIGSNIMPDVTIIPKTADSH